MTADQPDVIAADRFAAAFNRVARWLTRRGVSLLGSRLLEVRGRRSGEPRRSRQPLPGIGRKPVFRLERA